MHLKMVGKYLGHLLLAEAVFLLPPLAVAVIYSELHAALCFLGTAALCAFVAGLLHFLCRGEPTAIYAREAFVVAGAGWVLVSFFGALPFYFSGQIPNLFHAFFESASGFTTTGASILPDVTALGKSMLFWRSFTHWMGGIGVLAFILAVVRAKAGAGFSLQLLRAETPGPQVGKLMPKTRESVRSLFLVYGGLSLLNLIFLLAGGMPFLDALCTMFGTAGTGGFGIQPDSMASYSPYLQTVTTVFMALFGVNFSLYFLLLVGGWRTAIKDEELRWYLGIFAASALAIAASLVAGGYGSFGKSLHHSAFTVSSIMTTTGYTTADFSLWPEFARTLILILMIFGAMAGSTGGGFKIGRLMILMKSLRVGVKRLLHPRSVTKVMVNGKPLGDDVLARSQLYLVVYCLLLLVLFLLVSFDGLSLETNVSAVLSCANNIGPGLGGVGPMGNYSVYSNFSIFVLSFGMLLGRLEIFPIVILLLPSTWSSKT